MVYWRVEGHLLGKTRLRLNIPNSWEVSFVWPSMALLHVWTTKREPTVHEAALVASSPLKHSHT